MHITFKNQNYLNQFNILAGKGKKWLTDSFGKKSYSDMTEEEKNLVKEFGLKIDEYDALTILKNDYLQLAN